MSFIAGHYSWTYGASDLGSIEDAVQFNFNSSFERIVQNEYGDSLVDGVYRGGELFISMVLNEYDAAGAAAAFWPYSASFGAMGNPGVLLSSYAAALVGTAKAGTTATPSTITFANAALAPNTNLSLLFGTRKRNVPLRFQILPYENAGVDYWFTTA